MTTSEQAAASRANGRKSAGPRTAAGKARSARNATRHGLFARDALRPGEDAEAFARFTLEVHRQLKPETAPERNLCDQYVATAWRLKRLLRSEVAIFESARNLDGQAFDPVLSPRCRQELTLLSRYETGLQRNLERILASMQKVKAMRKAAQDGGSGDGTG